jgi:hypothetical protein
MLMLRIGWVAGMGDLVMMMGVVILDGWGCIGWQSCLFDCVMIDRMGGV